MHVAFVLITAALRRREGGFMANGKKNYFRHSFFAFEDEKIQKAVALLGYEGYAYYFILLEFLGRQCTDEVKNPITIHQQSLRNVWRKQSKSCKKVVEKLQESGLFVATFRESFVEFDIPNLSKYLGKYTNKNPSNAPNKIKENKIKENKIKGNERNKTTSANPSKKTITEKNPLIEIWNTMAERAGLVSIRGIGDKRKEQIKKTEMAIPGLNWKEYFQGIPDRDYLMGKADNGFLVTFDFAINQENVFKTLEGKYDKCFINKNLQGKNKEESQVDKLLNANPYSIND